MNSMRSLRHPLAVILSIGSIAALAGLAPTPVIVRDRFTNNALNTNFWTVHEFGVANGSETRQRFEFNAAVNSADEAYAGLEIKNWGANWRRDFEIEIDYRLNLANVTGDDEVLVGIGLALTGQFPEDHTGFGAFIGRTANRLFLVIARYTDGNLDNFDEVEITDVQDQLTLEWDRSSDQMTARAGGQEVLLDGAWADLGATFGDDPMVIAVGCLPLNGNRTFPGSRVWIDEFKFRSPGSRVWIDEFKFEGVKRGRP